MSERKQQREQKAADALAALGNRTRLRIFKLLVRAGTRRQRTSAPFNACSEFPQRPWRII